MAAGPIDRIGRPLIMSESSVTSCAKAASVTRERQISESTRERLLMITSQENRTTRGAPSLSRRNLAGQGGDFDSFDLSTRFLREQAKIKHSLLLGLFFRSIRLGSGGRHLENRIVHWNIQLNLGDRDLLLLIAAGNCILYRKGKHHPVHFFIIADGRINLLVCAADRALGDFFYLEERVRVEIDRLHIAVFQ